MDIAKRIIDSRTERGISQYKLAQLSGISQAGISQIESGKKQPTVTTLEKIIDVLGMTWTDLFNESSSLTPELQQLLNAAKHLTPEQINLLSSFIKSI